MTRPTSQPTLSTNKPNGLSSIFIDVVAMTLKLFKTHDAAKTQAVGPSRICIVIDVQLANCMSHAIKVLDDSCTPSITILRRAVDNTSMIFLNCTVYITQQHPFLMVLHLCFVFSLIIDSMNFLRKLSKGSQIRIQFVPIRIRNIHLI